MTKKPKWAEEIILSVCKEYNLSEPKVNWRRSHKQKKGFYTESNGNNIPIFKPKRYFSSGVAYTTENEISITAGSERKDQKLVLLHELAHLISPKEEHHGKVFWEIAWKLYRQYKVPINYAKEREYSYRKLAKKVLLAK